MQYFSRFLFLALYSAPLFVFAQKDCSNDHLGLIPLTDLGAGTFHGMQGGLYPGGTNDRPASHLAECIEQVTQIEALDVYGNPDTDGAIVMLGIGASNPMTEFQRFIELSGAYEPVNDQLRIINACAGGQGIQKMYDITDNYWSGVYNKLESEGMSADQVQVVWIEQDNTNAYDTLFPSAPNALVNDFRLLLEVIRQLFPNVRICYVTARAYSGFAAPVDPEVSGGLLYPRDYYNGWAVKFLVEKSINHTAGYEYEGPAASIPLVTWGSYHWTDGSTPRADGLYLDCELDLGPDGLHLSGQGEQKMGTQLFEYFKNDTTARYWYYDEDYSGLTPSSREIDAQVYPNPVAGDLLHVVMETQSGGNYEIFDMQGSAVISGTISATENSTISVSALPAGMYLLQIITGAGMHSSTFIRQ